MRTSYHSWLMMGVSIVSLALGNVAYAADEEVEILDDVVVSANRTETPLKSVGSTVTVITAKEIEESQFFLVPDLLNQVPGVNVSWRRPIGTASPLFSSMRGVDFQRVKMLVDGVQVDDFSGMTTSNIQRIEVLKGNQSTLYGSDAMGGVISITTKSGKNSKKLIGGSAFVELETLKGYKYGGNLNGRYEDVYYNLKYSQYDTDGFDISDDVRKSGQHGENDGYEVVNVDARIGADLLHDVGVLDKLNVEYIMQFKDSESEGDNSNSVTPPTDAFKITKSNSSHHKLQTKTDLWNGLLSNELSASYAAISNDEFLDGSRTNTDTEVRTVKYEYKGVLKPIDDHTLVFGTDYEKAVVKNGDFQRSQQGFYGNYQLELLDDALTLTMGSRYDKVDATDGQLTYRGTLGYFISSTGTRIHTSYGTGFGPANSSQLAWSSGDLTPEKSRSYDFGVEQSLWQDRIVIDVTAFNTRVKDEIAWDNTLRSYKNISSSRTFGLESSLAAEITDELSLDMNYTYQEPKDISSGTLYTWRPKHAGSATIRYTPKAFNGLSTWVRSTYRGHTSDLGANGTGGFVKHDIGASYDWDHGITFYGNVDNVFDKHYEYLENFATPGVVGTIGARVKF